MQSPKYFGLIESGCKDIKIYLEFFAKLVL